LAVGSEETDSKGVDVAYRVPAFSYPGGKVKLREWLVRRMPVSGGKYVEPFAGRGNVFWLAVHMLDYREWWLNDPWTCRWFEAIQRVRILDIPYELTEVLSRMYLKRSVHDRETDDVAVALEDRIMYSGGTACGVSSMWKFCPSLTAWKKNLVRSRSILKSVHPRITDLDWKDCHLENLSGEDFVYLDPPYETAMDGIYWHDTVVHRDLLRYLLEAPHLWMVSGYISPLYTRYLGDPEGQKIIRMSMHQQCVTNRGLTRNECIWTNYTIGADGKVLRKKLKQQKIRKIRRRK